MKPLITLVLISCLLFSLPGTAQIRKIPATVTEALQVQYPKASSIEWSDKITGYAATFTEGEKKLVAYYKNDATWERTEEEIEWDALPEEVQQAKEKSKYSEWENGVTQKILLPNDKVQYRIQVVKNDLQKKNLYYTPDGKMLKEKITL
jgi:hypothetical protein